MREDFPHRIPFVDARDRQRAGGGAHRRARIQHAGAAGAGTWSCFGALFGEHYPTALRATAAAFFYALARGVQLPLKPAIGEAFRAQGSFAPALWVGIACALGSAVVVLLLPRRGPPPQSV